MHAGDGREALDLVHRENQRTVHHPVDHEPMLFGIDLRNVEAAMRRHIVKRRRRDTSYRLAKRSDDVKRQPKRIGRRSPVRWLAQRGHEMGAIAIGDLILETFFSGRLRERSWRRCWCISWRRCGCLAAGGPYRSRDYTSDRGTAGQEFPSTRLLLRVHGSPFRRMNWHLYTPVTGVPGPLGNGTLTSLHRQGEGNNFVIGDLRPGEPASGAHNGDELTSIGRLVRDRRRLDR